MIVGACLCDVLPKIPTETQMTVVSHVLDLTRTTNTARLAALMLPDLTLVARGAAGQSELALPIERAAERRTVLLYPGTDSIELTAAWAHLDGRPITLIVPDGSWPQARRTTRRVAGLASLPRVRLPDGPPTRFWLRDQTRSDQHLCTLEAIARALGIIEGHRVEAMLLDGFDRFVQRILGSRGRLSGPQAFVPPNRPRGDQS